MSQNLPSPARTEQSTDDPRIRFYDLAARQITDVPSLPFTPLSAPRV